MKKIYFLTTFISCLSSFAEEKESFQSKRFTYRDRPHTTKETLQSVGLVYALSWTLYPLTQLETFQEKGSIKTYKKNFGKIVFDQDEPFWNWFIHPLSGSQLFLLYRGLGHSRVNSLGLAFVSSSLFELTIEIYTEPASILDFYQTPILGSLFGYWLENISLKLLNSKNRFYHVLGHVLNPTTLFSFNESRQVSLIPYLSEDKKGLFLSMDF